MRGVLVDKHQRFAVVLQNDVRVKRLADHLVHRRVPAGVGPAAPRTQLFGRGACSGSVTGSSSGFSTSCPEPCTVPDTARARARSGAGSSTRSIASQITGRDDPHPRALSEDASGSGERPCSSSRRAMISDSSCPR